MLDQVADKSKKQKIKKLDQFAEQLETELKSAEMLKSEHPERGDLNALIELVLAIQEEAKAVGDLVKIAEDCEEDWADLEEANGSLQRTLARVRYQNWITLGPSRSKRINQLFFFHKNQPDSSGTENLVQELVSIGRQTLDADLNSELRRKLEKLVELLEKGPGKGFLRKLSERVSDLEESMDASLLDAPLDSKCVICSSELDPDADSCPSCGVTFLTVKQATLEKEEEAGRSQLLDSLNHSWRLYQRKEINQENLLRIFKTLSEQISGAVANLDSPTAALLDFSARLEMFTKLRDRSSLQQHWPSLLASARAVVTERLSKLEREE